jgi:hypothetical protein
MNLVPIEAPPFGIAGSRKPLELLNGSLGILLTCYGLEVVADKLV